MESSLLINSKEQDSTSLKSVMAGSGNPPKTKHLKVNISNNTYFYKRPFAGEDSIHP
jgi:hypothetical protein